jgi:hypothetical protein
LGQTNLPQQPQYSNISTCIYNQEVKIEQLKLSKTNPSM